MKVVEYGMPQGTVLRPILFNLYFNGLLMVSTVSEIKFSDDKDLKLLLDSSKFTTKSFFSTI